MWKMTTGAGAVNFDYIRRIRTQKAKWIFKNKTYDCAVIVEGYDFVWDIEYFDDEESARLYVKKLLDQLNKVQVLDCSVKLNES